MPGQLPAALFCAVAIGLLGLAELVRAWDQEALQSRWSGSDWFTRRTVVTVNLVLIAVLIGFGVYSGTHSTPVPTLLLLGVFWVYARLIEAVIFWRKKYKRFALVLGLLAPTQLVGVLISSFLDSVIGRVLASSGVLAFHWSAVIFVLCQDGRFRQCVNITIAVVWLCIATASIGFMWIPDEAWFYVAHCLLESCALLAALLAALSTHDSLSPAPPCFSTVLFEGNYGYEVKGTSDKIFAQVLLVKDDESGTPHLKLEEDDWKVLNPNWRLWLKEFLPDPAFQNVLELVENGSTPWRISNSGEEVDKYVKPQYREALHNGWKIPHEIEYLAKSDTDAVLSTATSDCELPETAALHRLFKLMLDSLH